MNIERRIKSMKRAIPLPGSFILILAAVVCTMGALISGFVFTVDSGTLALAWLIAAMAMPAFAALWRGKGVLFLLVPIVALVVWKLPEIAEGAKSVINLITSEYNKWLFVPVFFQGTKATPEEVTLFFAAAGIVLAYLLYAAICVWKNSFLVVLFTAPIIFLTFVLVYNRPDPWYLIGLLGVYLTLLIYNALSREGEKRRAGSVFTAIALAVLLLAVAYFAISPEDYVRDNRVDSVDVIIRDFAGQVGIGRVKQGTGWPAVSTDGVWRFDTERVGVADAGLRTVFDQKVLEVTVSEPGTYYLRGYSMQRFDGRSWSVNSDSLMLPEEGVARGMPAYICWVYSQMEQDGASPIKEMVILGGGRSPGNIVYSPYFSIPDTQAGENYSFGFIYPEESVTKLVEENMDTFGSIDLSYYSQLIQSNDIYTQIDDYTARGLRRLAAEAGIDSRASRAEITEAVAAYISASGKYTLSPYIIPEGEDFALYFLENSKQGYCIHFATAATLMLRALDIPARVTSGFLITAPIGSAGRVIEVTDRSAHAWVEVFFENIGWLPLEVTPPGAGNNIPAGTLPAVVDRQGGPAYDEFDDMIPDWMMDQLLADRTNVRPGRGGAGSQAQAEPGAPVTVIAAAAGLVAAFIALIIRRKITRRNRAGRFAQADTNEAVMLVWRFILRINRNTPPSGEYEVRVVRDEAAVSRSESPAANNEASTVRDEEAEDATDRHETPMYKYESLALKARFSQHRVSEEERGLMVNYSKRLAEEIYEHRNLFGRVWLKWGLVI